MVYVRPRWLADPLAFARALSIPDLTRNGQ